MHVEIVSCLQDNYAYLLVTPSGEAAIVDPSEPEPVLDAVRRLGVRPTAIWNTHHHIDHVGGNEAIADNFPGIAVVGHTRDFGRIPRQTHGVEDGDEIPLGEARGRILYNPGHTIGAVTYLIDGNAFTGDTLFAAGCGRLFEGDAAMMFASLMRIATLPPETRVFPGHEYTVKNLEFARSVDCQNAAVGSRLEEARRMRARGLPTVPSTVAKEWASNPFLRAGDVATFAELRARKDLF
jgi:hydroxyacylglutathione hydrolase